MAMPNGKWLNKYDGLRAGDIEAFAAVLAHQHVIDAHEIIARFLKARSVLLVGAARKISLFRALQPTHVVFGALPAMRATIRRSFDFLDLVKEIAFVHSVSNLPHHETDPPPPLTQAGLTRLIRDTWYRRVFALRAQPDRMFALPSHNSRRYLKL